MAESKNFKSYLSNGKSELACHCNCGFNNISPELLKALENIREEFGKPITITSGTRCKAHNLAVGGHPNSAHMYGLAIDIAVENDRDREELLFWIYYYDEFIGKGIGKDFIHLDIKPRSHGKHTTWTY